MRLKQKFSDEIKERDEKIKERDEEIEKLKKEVKEFKKEMYKKFNTIENGVKVRASHAKRKDTASKDSSSLPFTEGNYKIHWHHDFIYIFDDSLASRTSFLSVKTNSKEFYNLITGANYKEIEYSKQLVEYFQRAMGLFIKKTHSDEKVTFEHQGIAGFVENSNKCDILVKYNEKVIGNIEVKNDNSNVILSNNNESYKSESAIQMSTYDALIYQHYYKDENPFLISGIISRSQLICYGCFRSSYKSLGIAKGDDQLEAFGHIPLFHIEIDKSKSKSSLGLLTKWLYTYFNAILKTGKSNLNRKYPLIYPIPVPDFKPNSVYNNVVLGTLNEVNTIIKVFDYGFYLNDEKDEINRRLVNEDFYNSCNKDFKINAKKRKINDRRNLLIYDYVIGDHDPIALSQVVVIANALKILHDKGYVHADVRGVNMIFDKTDLEKAILIDFDMTRKESSMYMDGYTKTLDERHKDIRRSRNSIEMKKNS